MSRAIRSSTAALFLLVASSSAAVAQVGDLGSEGGLLAVAAAGVAGAIYLARRKR